MESQWDGGTKVCSQGVSHMTRMAATPIYGKNPSKIFRTAGPIKAKFHMESQWDRGMKVCSRGLGHMTKLASMPIW